MRLWCEVIIEKKKYSTTMHFFLHYWRQCVLVGKDKVFLLGYLFYIWILASLLTKSNLSPAKVELYKPQRANIQKRCFFGKFLILLIKINPAEQWTPKWNIFPFFAHCAKLRTQISYFTHLHSSPYSAWVILNKNATTKIQ